MDNRTEVRARFSKEDRAVYISHLDLLRTMQRAIKRSGIPVWYSEGFNPRIYLNFPLPLSLGISSGCEAMDFYTVEDISFDEIKDRLNAALPVGIRIVDVYSPKDTNKDIKGAEYIISFGCGAENALDMFNAFMSAEHVEIHRKNKKKEIVSVDIKPFVTILSAEEKDGNAVIGCRLPAGNDMTVNPLAMMDSFAGKCAEKAVNVEKLYIKRTKILCDDNREFV